MRGVAAPYAVLAAVLVLNAAVAQTDPGLKGDTATATVKGKKGSRQLILRKEGGKWKLATL